MARERKAVATAVEVAAPPTLATPFVDLLPPLAQAEFDALEASIEREGVRDPIVTDELGNILDGHNRYRIAPDAPRRVVSGLSPAQKMAFVIAANFQRRNLSPDQKIEVGKRQREIAKTLRAEGMDQADIGAALGVAQNTVSDWLGVSNIGGDKAYADNRVKVPKEWQGLIFDRVESGEPQSHVAADYGVSRVRVSQICKAEHKRRVRELELAQQAADIAAGKVISAAGPFDVIVIDPPWPYGTGYDPEGRRAANPYPEMPLEQIAALDVAKRAAPDCVLWLWTTHKFLRHSFSLLDDWGFADKAILVSIEHQIGLGTWLRSQCEFCIMAARGSPPLDLTNQSTVLYAPRREHSRKPEEFYRMVESLCCGPRRYDWFSREQREGWVTGGNDTERFD